MELATAPGFSQNNTTRPYFVDVIKGTYRDKFMDTNKWKRMRILRELNFSYSCFLAKSLHMTELMRFQPFARQVYLTSKPLSSIMTIFFLKRLGKWLECYLSLDW